MKILLCLLLTTPLYISIVFAQEHYDNLIDRAETEYEKMEYETAINNFDQAAKIAINHFGENSLEFATIINKIANCYYNINEFEKALNLHLKVLNIKTNILGEAHLDCADSFYNIGNCYFVLGHYKEAVVAYNQAYAIRKSNYKKDDYECAILLQGVADSLIFLGDYNSARDLYSQTIRIFNDLSSVDLISLSSSIEGLAMCSDELGDYVGAIDYYQQALEIVKRDKGDNHTDYAMTLNNLALSYQHIGKYSDALNLFIRVSKILNNSKSHRLEYAMSLNNIALCYDYLEDISKAITMYTQALRIYEETVGKEHPWYAMSLNNLACCYTYIGEYFKAFDLHQQALLIYKGIFGVNHHDYAMSLSDFAICHDKLGYYYNAAKMHMQALRVYKRTIGDRNVFYMHSLREAMISYYHVGRYRKVILIWQRLYDSIRTNTVSQFKFMTSEQRYIYWSSQIFSILNTPFILISPNVLDHSKSVKVAYNSLLLTKGTMLAIDADFANIIGNSGNVELLAKFEELRMIRHNYTKPISERANNEVERLETKADILEKELILASREYADYTQLLSIEWGDVRNILDNNDVAIEIKSADELIEGDVEPYIAAFILRKGWSSPEFAELCKLDELEQLFGFKTEVYNNENSHILYNLIWSKLEPYINEGDDVYFAPDGLLYQMNIEVLQDANGRRANEKWNLHRVSSTRELCMEKPELDINSAVLYGGLKYTMDDDELLVASRTYSREDMQSATRGFVADSTMRKGWNYLPETKTEVEAIAQMCESHNVRTEIFSETAGNEESFKALSGKKTPIIHLATHGFFYKNEQVTKKPFFSAFNFDQMPQRADNSLKRSGLILAGGQKAWLGEAIPDSVEDGILLAEEIAMMDLAGTDLVVLSACETGLGEITSEGVFGLQRAFKKAGVQTIIMSLWSVNDLVASLFMRVFYQEWLSGKTKHEAFAIAQNTVRESYEGNDWAAFIMLD